MVRTLSLPKILVALWLLTVGGLMPQSLVQAGDPVVVQSVIVTLIDDVAVAAQQAGVVMEKHVREGDSVQQGDLLVSLDDADARIEQQRLLAELKIAETEAANRLKVDLAEKSLGVASAELLRAEQSNVRFSNSVSETELDQLRFSRDQAALQIQHAEHELELAEMRVLLTKAELDLAKLVLSRRQIRSPIDGIVVRMERQPGEWIQTGESVCRIIRLNRLRAEGFVNIRSGTLKLGQLVELQLNEEQGEPHKFRGELSFIDPEINPITGQYRVWAEIENPEGKLRPGHRPQMICIQSSEVSSN